MAKRNVNDESRKGSMFDAISPAAERTAVNANPESAKPSDEHPIHTRERWRRDVVERLCVSDYKTWLAWQIQWFAAKGKACQRELFEDVHG